MVMISYVPMTKPPYHMKADQNLLQLFLSDTKSFFSKNYGWMLGERNGRWAMVIDKDGKSYPLQYHLLRRMLIV
jgi:hypothetical protein